MARDKQQKIALAVEALRDYVERWGDRDYYCPDIAELASRSELSQPQLQAVIRLHADEIGRELGMRVTYQRSRYDASGSGPFGRYSNQRSRYNRAWVELCSRSRQ